MLQKAGSLSASDFEGFSTVEISAKSGDGYDELSKLVAGITSTEKLSPDSAVLLSERQRTCAKQAFDALNQAIDTLYGGNTIDAVGVCVDDALSALLTLTGKRVTNEVSDEIFRRFCVGK